MTIQYCCYGMYADVGHDDDCPERLVSRHPAPHAAVPLGPTPVITMHIGGRAATGGPVFLRAAQWKFVQKADRIEVSEPDGSRWTLWPDGTEAQRLLYRLCAALAEEKP